MTPQQKISSRICSAPALWPTRPRPWQSPAWERLYQDLCASPTPTRSVACWVGCKAETRTRPGLSIWGGGQRQDLADGYFF